MGFPVNLYSDAYKRMVDFIVESNTGGSVENLARDLLNRAQEQLRMYRMWEELTRRETLTVNSSNNSYLPTDCGEIIGIYHDSDNDGRPDWWYWNRSKRVDQGYYFGNDFDRLSGYSRYFHFFTAPNHTPILWYVRTLEAFVGTNTSGDDTEYSFFPLDLLVVTAQIIHRSEQDIIENSYEVLELRRQQLLADYEQSHQWINADMGMEVNDANGDLVYMNEYNLSGGGSRDASPHDNDYDDRGTW